MLTSFSKKTFGLFHYNFLKRLFIRMVIFVPAQILSGGKRFL